MKFEELKEMLLSDPEVKAEYDLLQKENQTKEEQINILKSSIFPVSKYETNDEINQDKPINMD